MRVLTVGSLYPPHDAGGGYEILWRSAVEALRQASHDVRVLATEHRNPAVTEQDPEPGDVHRELRWYWEDHAFPRRGLRSDLATERHNTAVLNRHIREFHPDRLAWWSMGGLSMSLLETGRRAGVPAVAFVIDDWLDYGPRADGWQRRFAGRQRLARVAERLTGVPTRVDYADAAHYAFVSATTRDHAWIHGVPTPERSIVNAGIDPALIDPAPPREWDWSLLYVGRIDRRKGIETAVDALALLPAAATLTVAGDGASADVCSLRDRAQARGVADRVRMLGHQERAALPGLYADADAVVFPVLWSEPWGLVPLEAMARGRPVVATGRGGSAEYLRDGVNSLLFGAGDAGALADRLRRLAGDAGLRQRLRDGGLQTAACHTEPTANAQIEATLRACRLRPRARPAQRPARVAAVKDGRWEETDAEIILFLGEGVVAAPGLAAVHAESHRHRPEPTWAVQGAVLPPREPFAHWLAGHGHPPLGPPAAGEIGPVRLDLRHISIKRELLERAGGIGAGGLDLAHRLADLGLRLRLEPQARARLARVPTVEEARARMPAAARAERAFVAAHPHLVPWLRERMAHAAARGPARGRLGRALVAHVPESVPWLGPRVWANADHHYEALLAPEYLAASD